MIKTKDLTFIWMAAAVFVLLTWQNYLPTDRLSDRKHFSILPASAAASQFNLLPIVYRPASLSVFGVEMEDISIAGGLELIDKAGTYWVRHNSLYWPDAEPVEGERHWDDLKDLEEQLIAANERNLQVILVVRGTPSWAQMVEGSICGPIKEEKLQAFASFLHDAVERYSQSPYFVKYWEIGNEPDAPVSFQAEPFGCWGDQGDSYFGGGYYAEMLKLAYPAIKSAAPQAVVLLGGLLLDCDPVNPPEDPPGSGELKDCTSSQFLEGIPEWWGDYFDMVSFHAYDYYEMPGKVQ
jgi:hypothetical protein